MKKVKINQDGYVLSLNFPDADIQIDITDDDYEKISSCKIGYNWRYINNEFIMVPILTNESLKKLRQVECFNIIDNRSSMWYEHLSQERKNELNAWYQAWLDVTETKVIPTKPEWL